MSSGVEDASLLVDTLYIDAQQLFENVEFGVEIEVPVVCLVQIVAYLFKYPGAPEGGTTYHDGIHAIFVEGSFGLFGRGDVAIANDWESIKGTGC